MRREAATAQTAFLGPTPPVETVVLGVEVAAFLALGSPSTLDQQGLEPPVAFSQPGGSALAGTLVVARAQPSPRQEVSRGREPVHVRADLRQDDPRRQHVDAWDRDQKRYQGLKGPTGLGLLIHPGDERGNVAIDI